MGGAMYEALKVKLEEEFVFVCDHEKSVSDINEQNSIIHITIYLFIFILSQS